MGAIDLKNFFKPEIALAVPTGVARVNDVYDVLDGFQWRSQSSGELVQECVRLSEGALLLTSAHSPGAHIEQRQVITGGDWIHVQLNLSGSASERVAKSTLSISEGSCAVSRYPADSVVERQINRAGQWRVVCLFMRPNEVESLLNIDEEELPSDIRWIANGGGLPLVVRSLTLPSELLLAANEILSCSLKGSLRRSYMRGRTIQILSTILSSINQENIECRAPRIRLSRADAERIANVRRKISNCYDCNLTLAELARQGGVNRTKLAQGFKELFGVSVQAYWRDVKLQHAHELLKQRMTVTDVALKLGYSDLSSFTRAFTQKFGFAPRACRKLAAVAAHSH